MKRRVFFLTKIHRNPTTKEETVLHGEIRLPTMERSIHHDDQRIKWYSQTYPDFEYVDFSFAALGEREEETWERDAELPPKPTRAPIADILPQKSAEAVKDLLSIGLAASSENGYDITERDEIEAFTLKPDGTGYDINPKWGTRI